MDRIYFAFTYRPGERLVLLLLLYRDFAYRKAVYLPNEMPPFLGAASIDWILAAQRRPKLFVYDEFHNLKNNEPILDVLDKDARQQRTLGLATYLVTQDILDVAEKGNHFISAASNKYFTRHVSPDNPTMEGIDNLVRIIGLGSQERELLLSLKFYPVNTPRSWRSTRISARACQRPDALNLGGATRTHKDERWPRGKPWHRRSRRRCHKGVAKRLPSRSFDMLPGSIGQPVDIGAVMKKIEPDGYFRAREQEGKGGHHRSSHADRNARNRRHGAYRCRQWRDRRRIVPPWMPPGVPQRNEDLRAACFLEESFPGEGAYEIRDTGQDRYPLPAAEARSSPLSSIVSICPLWTEMERDHPDDYKYLQSLHILKAVHQLL